MEMDYGEDQDGRLKSKIYDKDLVSKSKLPGPTQKLIHMIFDIEKIEQTMKEFEVG